MRDRLGVHGAKLGQRFVGPILFHQQFRQIVAIQHPVGLQLNGFGHRFAGVAHRTAARQAQAKIIVSR